MTASFTNSLNDRSIDVPTGLTIVRISLSTEWRWSGALSHCLALVGCIIPLTGSGRVHYSTVWRWSGALFHCLALVGCIIPLYGAGWVYFHCLALVGCIIPLYDAGGVYFHCLALVGCIILLSGAGRVHYSTNWRWFINYPAEWRWPRWQFVKKLVWLTVNCQRSIGD